MESPKPSVCAPVDSLWNEAFQHLAPEDRATLQALQSTSDRTDILEAILQIAEKKKELCLEKRWTLVRGGKTIVLRDKLDKIVTWVQRFKEIGSVAVSYDPAHAALPWAAVLFILQCATSDAQTFGAMVEGIESVSLLVARYSAFDLLQSPKQTTTSIENQLRIALLKLDISILRYLASSAQYFSKGTACRVLASTVRSPESQVTRYLDIISKKATTVDSCLLVYQAEKSHAVDERTSTILKCLSVLQGPIIRTTTEVAELYKQLKREDRTKVSAWLSTVNGVLHHRSEGREYMAGSGAWLLERPELLGWRHSSTSSTLWLHGIPGCGKTKLVYRLVQEFLDTNKAAPQPAPFAFFYCARNPAEPERSNPIDILRSLLKQLSVDVHGRLKDPVVKAFRTRQQQAELYGEVIEPLDVSEVVVLILEILEKDPAVIIIDALDECDPIGRYQLISALDTILKQAPNVVKIMISSRDDGDIRAHFARSPDIFIRADDNREDLNKFVHYSLSKAEKGRRILHGNLSPALRAEILASLERGARGMFRWVSLQIEALCNFERIKIDTDIREELGKLPQTLKESYSRTYDKVMRLSRPSYIIADRVFKWLLCAKRLLNFRDLTAAVTFASERQQFNIENILDICHNMVIVDDHGFFRFAHLSVREYLEGLDGYTPDRCNSFVLQRCLEAYTNIAVGQLSWSQDTVDYDLKAYSMLYWPAHLQQTVIAVTPNQLVMNLTEDFIFERGQADLNGRTILAQHFKDWLDDSWNASRYAVIEETTEHTTLDMLGSAANRLHTPQFLACLLDMTWLLACIDGHGWKDWNIRNFREETCVQITTVWNSSRALQWLLTESTMSKEVLTEACHLNIKARRTEIVLLLIQHGVDIYGSLPGRHCLLYEAVSEGLEQTVEVMLRDKGQMGIDGFVRSMSLAFTRFKEDIFPHFWAACAQFPASTFLRCLLFLIHPYEDIPNHKKTDSFLRMLICFPESTEGSDLHDVSRLMTLLEDRFDDLHVLPDGSIGVKPYLGRDDTSSILHLLDNAPVEKADSIYEAFKILLRLTADVTYRDGKGRTLLMLAAKSGLRTDLMYELLKHGYSLESTDDKGQSALHHAVKSGNAATIEILLSWNSEFNSHKRSGGTSLLSDASAACEHENIKLLRRYGVERVGSNLDIDGILVPWLPLLNCNCCIVCAISGGTNEQDRRSGISDIFNHIADLYQGPHPVPDDLERRIPHNLETTIIPNMKSWEDGMTLLQVAISLMDMDLVRQLLDIPVDVNAVDKQGFTALHYAVLTGRASDLTMCLLEHQADPCIQDSQGRTPLHLALIGSHWAGLSDVIIRILKASKAPLNVQDINGNTVLHTAILLHSRKDVAQALLNAGADLTIVNNNNQTPMGLALIEDYFPLIDVTFDIFSDAHETLFDPTEVECFSSLLQNETMVTNFNVDNRNESGIDGEPKNDASKEKEESTGNITATDNVDFFAGYGTVPWSALGGGPEEALRPLDAKYFEQGYAKLGL